MEDRGSNSFPFLFMGLFSSKKYNVVSTAVQTLNLMEPSTLLKDSTMSAIYAKQPVAQVLVNDYVGGGKGFAAQNYYNFGRTKFTNGLVEGTSGTDRVPVTLIRQTIINEVGALPEGIQIKFEPPTMSWVDPGLIAFEYIKQEHPDWLHDPIRYYQGMVELRPYYAKNYYWDQVATIKQYINGGQRCIFVTFDIERKPVYDHKDHVVGYMTVRTNETTHYFNLPDTFKYVDEDDIRYNCTYYIGNDTDGWIKYEWEYYTSDGKYPELDPEAITKGINRHLPVVPIRLDNMSMVSGPGVKDTPLYKTSRTILDKLGISLSEIGKAIDDNPDVKDIDHVYFVIAPKVTNKAESTSEYFYRYFLDLYIKDFSSSYDEYLAATVAGSASTAPINGIILHDKESQFRADLQFHYIRFQTRKGKLGAKYKHTIVDKQTLKIEHQATDDVIAVLTVAGMKYMMLLWKAWGDKGSPWNENYLDAPEDDNNFLIPINISVLQSMDMISADKLIQDSCSLVVQSWETQRVKVKWYQTGFFKIFVQIVSITISVISFGTLTAIGVAIAMIALEPIIIKIFDMVVDLAGVEVAVIAAVVATLVGGYSTLMGIGSTLTLPLASTMTFASTNLFKAIGLQVQDAYKDVLAEMEEFNSMVEGKWTELKEVNDALNPVGILDPMKFIETIDMSIHESPDTWIERKTLQNPGYLAIDAVYNFVDNALLTPIDIWRK